MLSSKGGVVCASLMNTIEGSLSPQGMGVLRIKTMLGK
jgi:hypothetical protein